MSAILVHTSRRKAVIASDAGVWSDDGTLAAVQSKIVPLPDAIGVIVARGYVSATSLIRRDCLGGPFDRVVRDMPDALRSAIEATGARSAEVFVIGVSETTGEVQAYYVASHDRHRPAYSLTRMRQLASPPPDGFTFAGFTAGKIADVFERMRATLATPVWGASREKRSLVAGFCEVATIDRNGVTREIVRRWPDIACDALPATAIEAEEMLFTNYNQNDVTNRFVTINANINNVNLRTLHDNIFPELTEDDITASPPVTVTFILAENVIVGSTNTANPALDVGEWLDGFAPTLNLLGRIQGKGGKGGDASPFSLPTDGGTALFTRHALNVDGAEGEIWGGGGGGRALQSGGANDSAGGGGAGRLPGAGGVPEGSGNAGQPGTTEAGGDGFGDGGGPGLPGQTTFQGAGGAAGSAIDGVSFVTFATSPAGDIRGPQVN